MHVGCDLSVLDMVLYGSADDTSGSLTFTTFIFLHKIFTENYYFQMYNYNYMLTCFTCLLFFSILLFDIFVKLELVHFTLFTDN